MVNGRREEPFQVQIPAHATGLCKLLERRDFDPAVQDENRHLQIAADLIK